MTKEQRVNLETAKLAKEKGFDWETNAFKPIIPGETETVYLLPTQALLNKWLREVHQLHVHSEFKSGSWYCSVVHFKKGEQWYISAGKIVNSYEESMEIGLEQALRMT